MIPPLRRRFVIGSALGSFLVLGLGITAAQDEADAKGKRNTTSAKAAASEKAEGVIVKVEPFRKGANQGSTIDRLDKEGKDVPVSVRLTINTAAVWRDWVRDEATNPAGRSAAGKAKGDNTVATKGQPATPDTVVVVDIGPETKLESRFRSSTDETDDGSATVAGAEEKDADPADTSRKSADKSSKKSTALKLADLKAGQFVVASYRHTTAQNPASRVIVLKPIGGADTPAREAEPKKK